MIMFYGLIRIYVSVLGVVLILIGLMEVILPEQTFRLWEKWISNRLFFLHGILLIAAGFPLTIYRGVFSSVIFFIGIVMVLSGPFVLFYPEKIKKSFKTLSDEIIDKGVKKIMFFDAGLRLAIGSVLLVSFFL